MTKGYRVKGGGGFFHCVCVCHCAILFYNVSVYVLVLLVYVCSFCNKKMQDHFTKWVEDQAICGKEALTVADAVVQDWILKHCTPVTLHSDRRKVFTAALHQEVCDLLCIAKTCSTAYCPQTNDMV